MINITDKLLSRFHTHLITNEASLATISKYLHDVRLLRELMGRKITGMHQLSNYKRRLQELGYAARSINSMLSAVNRFTLFCGHPEWKLKFLKIQRRIFSTVDREITASEYLRLVASSKRMGDERLALLLQTICVTGIRVSEVRAITVESLQMGMSEIYSKGKVRQIILPRSLCKLLQAYCVRNAITRGSVFLGSKGKPLNRSSIWRRMKLLCVSAHVKPEKVFPHNLRHLFARCFYKKYKDIVGLADILGHSSIETTRIYTIKNSSSEQLRLENLRLLLPSET